MTDYIKRADAIDAVVNMQDGSGQTYEFVREAMFALKALPSADAEPKWNCTANFVAEQLDRLRKMTDEEKLEFFKRFFEMKGGAE